MTLVLTNFALLRLNNNAVNVLSMAFRQLCTVCKLYWSHM